MKTERIAKLLATAALASLAFAAGTSQADSFGYPGRGHAPGFQQTGFGPAYCLTRTDYSNIDQRQRAQMERIYEGVRTGQLTRGEARTLIQEQKRIEQLQRRYLADGFLDRGEWADLERRLDTLSQDIREEKHDREYAGPNRHAWR